MIKVDNIFKALGDPHRSKIFHLLVVGGALSISALSAEFTISRQGLTKHINIMEDAGILQVKKEGRTRMCQANLNSINLISNWLDYYTKFWETKLDNLDDFLTKTKKI